MNVPTTETWWATLSAQPPGGYSQKNEEAILRRIFEKIGTTSRCLVDLGAGNGVKMSNVRWFIEQEWQGCLLDGAYSSADVSQEWITADNIVELLDKYDVPATFDLLSIDIDGQDYWVLEALLASRRPRVIVAEYNGVFEENVCKTVPRDPHFRFAHNDYYGASYGALCKLANHDGYRTLCNNGLNVFFIEESCAPEGLVDPPYGTTHGWPAAPGNPVWVAV